MNRFATALTLLVAALSLVLAPRALAQPEAGDWTLTLGAGGSADNDFEDGNFNVDGSIGYFLTERLEFALRQSVSYSDNGGTTLNGTTRAAVDYHFDLGKFQPFIGGNIGYFYGRDMDDVGAVAPEAGIKYYVKEKTFVFGLVEYQVFFDRVRDVDNNADDGRFRFTVGIGFNF